MLSDGRAGRRGLDEEAGLPLPARQGDLQHLQKQRRRQVALPMSRWGRSHGLGLKVPPALVAHFFGQSSIFPNSFVESVIILL